MALEVPILLMSPLPAKETNAQQLIMQSFNKKYCFNCVMMNFLVINDFKKVADKSRKAQITL